MIITPVRHPRPRLILLKPSPAQPSPAEPNPAICAPLSLSRNRAHATRKTGTFSR